MTSPATTRLRPVLAPRTVYWADNGRRVCATCAGASARFTGRDLSGQCVERVTVEDAIDWQRELGRALDCERGCTVLAPIAGPDGWPLARRGRP